MTKKQVLLQVEPSASVEKLKSALQRNTVGEGAGLTNSQSSTPNPGGFGFGEHRVSKVGSEEATIDVVLAQRVVHSHRTEQIQQPRHHQVLFVIRYQFTETPN